MASVTAEVLLHFGTDDERFKRSVDIIRFSQDPQLEAWEIIDLISPIYNEGYASGWADRADEL